MADSHYLCPVYGCEFTLPHEEVTSWMASPDESWAAAFERAVIDADTERARTRREHVESHTPEDYLRTITLLRPALGTAEPLVDFLRARLAEDEAAAHAALGDGQRWAAEPYGGGLAFYLERGMWTIRGPRENDRARDPEGGPTSYERADVEHIARWDPSRVLADITARRKVIDALEWFIPDTQWSDYAQPGRGVENRATDALRAMAQSYAGHPDWQPEWADADV